MQTKKLGFGCMRLPLKIPKIQTSIDKKQVCEMADAFIENGFTYFDTAYMYHAFKSETAMRECLVQRHPRESFTLADKLPVSPTYRLSEDLSMLTVNSPGVC